jgi:hypothetical protein
MPLVGPLEELNAGHPGHLVGREHGDYGGVRRHPKDVQPIERGRRRCHTDDLVVVGVPAGKFPLQHTQLTSLFVNHYQNWLGHRDPLSPGRHLAAPT